MSCKLSGPASHLAKSRFCSVTFLDCPCCWVCYFFVSFAGDSLLFGMVILCSRLFGMLFSAVGCGLLACRWRCPFCSFVSLSVLFDVLLAADQAQHLLDVCIAFETFFGGATLELLFGLMPALSCARRQRRARGHCSRCRRLMRALIWARHLRHVRGRRSRRTFS